MRGQFPNGGFPFLENDGLYKQAKNGEKNLLSGEAKLPF